MQCHDVYLHRSKLKSSPRARARVIKYTALKFCLVFITISEKTIIAQSSGWLEEPQMLFFYLQFLTGSVLGSCKILDQNNIVLEGDSSWVFISTAPRFLSYFWPFVLGMWATKARELAALFSLPAPGTYQSLSSLWSRQTQTSPSDCAGCVLWKHLCLPCLERQPRAILYLEWEASGSEWL